jgi:hypothetical protein
MNSMGGTGSSKTGLLLYRVRVCGSIRFLLHTISATYHTIVSAPEQSYVGEAKHPKRYQRRVHHTLTAFVENSSFNSVDHGLEVEARCILPILLISDDDINCALPNTEGQHSPVSHEQ